MLLKDTHIGALIGLEGTAASVKRRLRKMADQRNIEPVQKCRGFWLWNESDIDAICSKLPSEETPPTGKSPGRIKESGFGKVRARRIKTRQRKFSENEYRRLTAGQQEGAQSRTQ